MDRQEHRIEDDSIEIDLVPIFKALWRGRFKIISTAIVCAALMGGFIFSQPRLYESKAIVNVGYKYDNKDVAAYGVASVKDRFLSRDLLPMMDAEEFGERVSVDVGKNSQAFTIGVKGETPEEAQKLCELLLENYEKFHRDEELPRLERQIEITKQQLEEARLRWVNRQAQGNLPSMGRAAEEELYMAQVNKLNKEESSLKSFDQKKYFTWIMKPSLPTKPASRNGAKMVGGAAGVGLALGIFMVLGGYIRKSLALDEV